MSQTNLLHTQTPNYLELMGNGKFYQVPLYQRDYSWTEEQWEALWNDIVDLMDESSPSHYMGAMVMQAVKEGQFEIIDGQQRITTLSIITLSIINRLNELASSPIELTDNKERAQQLRSDYIGKKDAASLIEITKLKLNENNNGFFQDYIIRLRSPQNKRTLSASNRLLFEAFEYFKGKVGNLDIANNGYALASFLSGTIAKKLLFIVITVRDELNAYTVFETLNARGIELSSTDLIKNFLFSTLKSNSDIHLVNQKWRVLVSTVGQERFPDFLRYYYMRLKPDVRKPRLFKYVREQIVQSEDVITLLDNLDRYAELYAALRQPAHEWWLDNRKEAIPYLKELKLFGVSQMMPLLFAAWYKVDFKHFVKLLKLLSILSFRFSVICQLNPNKLESVYQSTAQALEQGEIKTYGQIYERLSSVYVSDEEFMSSFSLRSFSTSGNTKRIAKYILCQLENCLSDSSIDWEMDPATLEHVLPENPDTEWSECFSSEDAERFTYRIGNLTLLERTLNGQMGNKLFMDKQFFYKQSRYQLSRQLAEPDYAETWGPEHINTRQQQMAVWATDIWKADFS